MNHLGINAKIQILKFIGATTTTRSISQDSASRDSSESCQIFLSFSQCINSNERVLLSSTEMSPAALKERGLLDPSPIF